MKFLKKILLALPAFVFFLGVGVQVHAATQSTTIIPKPLYVCYQAKGLKWGSVQSRAAEAAKYGIFSYKGTVAQNSALSALLCPPSDFLGFAVITDYQKALSAPITSTQSTIQVTSITLKDGTTFNINDLGGKVFLTLEPGAAKEEIVMCTGLTTGTLTFTGCNRGLAFKGTSTSSVQANQQTHNAGSVVVMSNVHYVYQQFLDINSEANQVASGTYTFVNFPSVTSTTAAPTLANQLATKYYVDQQLAAGFSCASASSTLGIVCSGSPAVFGVNASSTGGLAFDLSGALYVLPTFNFPATFNASTTFNSTSTFNGNIVSNVVPTTGSSLTNKTYVDTNVSWGTATGTINTTIVAGNALYVSPTSTLGLASSAATSTAYTFAGIALTGGSAGAAITYVKPGGIATTLSGLTPGASYFLSTAGALSKLPGAVPVKVGVALSATNLQVMTPGFHARQSGLFGVTVSSTVALGWIPDRVDLTCVMANSHASQGFFAVNTNSNNTSSQQSVGYDSSSGVGASFKATCNDLEPTWNSLIVSTTTNGFFMNVSGTVSVVQYTATYDSNGYGGF